jgi:hypothetical protein
MPIASRELDAVAGYAPGDERLQRAVGVAAVRVHGGDEARHGVLLQTVSL